MKKLHTLLLSLTAAAVLTACSGSAPAAPAPSTETALAETPSSDPAAPADTSSADTSATDTIRIGSLKGPTSMGIVSLMEQAEKGETTNSYEFTMAVAADELTSAMVSEDLDIALIPANAASILYNKTSGQISVIDINTLGVLDVVTADESVQSFSDLKGKTVCMTGKGTTPDYVFHYLLAANGLTENDVKLEFKSEPTEVAAVLKADPSAIGVLPQPFVTAACVQNEALKIALDLTKEWDAVQGENGSRLVTGVTVVRKTFLEEHTDAVLRFLEDHEASAAYAESNPDETAELIAAKGIVEKAPVARKALPYCNIVCITGDDMKTALSGYLETLAEQEPKAVGGQLPADDFYFRGQ